MRKFGQVFRPPPIPTWTRDDLLRYAHVLKPGHFDVRDDKDGTMDIYRDGNIIARISLSERDQKHRINFNFPDRIGFEFVDGFENYHGSYEPDGGLAKCLECSMTHFKSAVSEAFYGRASKRPIDWLCGHVPKRCIDPEMLVDVLVCLNCERFHYLSHTRQEEYQVHRRSLKLEDSGVDVGHVVAAYEVLFRSIDETANSILPASLVGIIAGFLAPRDGTFIVPSHPVKDNGFVNIPPALTGECRGVQIEHVTVNQEGEVVFLESSILVPECPIRMMRVESHAHVDFIRGYMPGMRIPPSYGSDGPDLTNFLIPYGYLEPDGSISWYQIDVQ